MHHISFSRFTFPWTTTKKKKLYYNDKKKTWKNGKILNIHLARAVIIDTPCFMSLFLFEIKQNNIYIRCFLCSLFTMFFMGPNFFVFVLLVSCFCWLNVSWLSGQLCQEFILFQLVFSNFNFSTSLEMKIFNVNTYLFKEYHGIEKLHFFFFCICSIHSSKTIFVHCTPNCTFLL